MQLPSRPRTVTGPPIEHEGTHTMDLTTRYLGLSLPHPITVGACPLSYETHSVRSLEDAGAALVVMPSLFEEQIVGEQMAAYNATTAHDNASAEALSYFPEPDQYKLGPDAYLERIRELKAAVDIPVVASLNGQKEGRWIEYAGLMAEAGADALELNMYYLATDPDASGAQIEQRCIDLARAVKTSVSIPVAVKLSPFFSSLPHFARQLESIGIDGLVIFNRFYQPDIDVEELEIFRVNLSDSSELLLRLRWLGILSPLTSVPLAATGGVHSGLDAVKALMAGARVVQVVSSLLRDGPGRLTVLRDELSRWLDDHEYASLQQLQGSMNMHNCPDPAAYERANYVQILQSWRT